MGLQFSDNIKSIANTLKAKYQKHREKADLNSIKVFYNFLTTWVVNVTEQPVLDVKKLLIQISELSHKRLISALKSYLRHNAVDVSSPVIMKSQNPRNNPSLLITRKQPEQDPKRRNQFDDNYNTFKKRKDFPIHPLKTNTYWLMTMQSSPNLRENHEISGSPMQLATNQQFHGTEGLSRFSSKLNGKIKNEVSNIEKHTMTSLPVIVNLEEKGFYSDESSAANLTKITATQSDSKLKMKYMNYLKSDLKKAVSPKGSPSDVLLEPSLDYTNTTHETTKLTKLYLNNNTGDSLVSNNALLDGSQEKSAFNFVGRQGNALDSTIQADNLFFDSPQKLMGYKEKSPAKIAPLKKHQRGGSGIGDHGMVIRSYNPEEPEFEGLPSPKSPSNVLALLLSKNNKQELQPAEDLLPNKEIEVLAKHRITPPTEAKSTNLLTQNHRSYFMASPSNSDKILLLP